MGPDAQPATLLLPLSLLLPPALLLLLPLWWLLTAVASYLPP
jgi:hypothetical protein